MPTMSPDFKKRWLDALRSGTYPQCRLTLYDGAGYCCLGVAVKVALEAELIPADRVEIRPALMAVRRYPDASEHTTTGKPPAWFWHNIMGLGPDDEVRVDGSLVRVEGELIRQNDEAQLSFREIADWIEANL